MNPPASSPTAATIVLTIDAFFPIGSIYSINYAMALTSGNTANFNLTDGLLTVTVPVDTNVTLNYELNDPRYVLLGIAFNPNGPGAGRKEFPQVLLTRTLQNSTMAVTDASRGSCEGIDYTYVILVQEAASGSIGLIDPGIVNEPE